MIGKALERQNNELDFIRNLQSSPSAWMYLKKLYYKVYGKDFDFKREPHTAKEYAKQIKASLRADTDVIFSTGTIPISLLETNKPKAFYGDATFAGMIGFYKDLSNLSSATIKHGHYLEKQALESAQLAIYSSDWAAKTAIDHYGIDPAKVKVVPFGSNIESERNLDDIKMLISRRSKKECNLLFLAVDWERKGGDMAVKVARKLNEIGVKTTLHIVGIKELTLSNVPPFVKNYGFVSKATTEGRRLMDKLLSESHFLILPTLADCTPVVFSEANSFGLPCIASNVGGITTVIRDNMNGYTFSLSDDENSYAEYIVSLFRDWKRYNELALSSFYEYEHRLNWDVAGKTITKLIGTL